MKKSIYFATAILATAFTACSTDDDVQISNGNEEITITAKLPQEAITRVSLTDESEGNTYIAKAKWSIDVNNKDLVGTYFWSKDATPAAIGKYNRPVTADVSGTTGTFGLADRPKNNSFVYCWYPGSNGYSHTLGGENTGDAPSCSWTPSDNRNYIFASIEEITTQNFMVGSLYWDLGNSGATGDKVVNFKSIYALLKVSVEVPTTASSLTTIKKLSQYYSNNPGSARIRGTVTLTGSTGVITWTDDEGGSYFTEDNGINVPLTGDGNYKKGTFYVLMTPQLLNGIYLQVSDGTNTYSYYKASPTESDRKKIEAGMMYSLKARLTKD